MVARAVARVVVRAVVGVVVRMVYMPARGRPAGPQRGEHGPAGPHQGDMGLQGRRGDTDLQVIRARRVILACRPFYFLRTTHNNNANNIMIRII